MATTTTRTNPLSYLTDQLNELKQKGTYFKLRVLDDEQAPVCTFDGKKVINIASNNYLGLTTHPKLREAALAATKKYGVGSGAVLLEVVSTRLSDVIELASTVGLDDGVADLLQVRQGGVHHAGTRYVKTLGPLV